ncbi:flavin reductase family protein [Devosia sp. Leaf64]|uniref:flavin reductase family protein n=1 Tax=Devosia sp. Leaf64 TaxID=1736229 RepID=UPI0009EB0CD2|nr:flavin reductase family protein [Devosia sp. Leaf64]
MMIATKLDSAHADADPAAFKLAMRHLLGAVSVITVGTGAEITGFTATSVSSLSIEPATILVSLNRSSSSWTALLEAQAFAVNILSADQSDIASRFAGIGGVKGNDRYLGSEWTRGVTGSRLLEGALSSIDCTLEDAIERHSHAILIGRVRPVSVETKASPLGYFDGAFRTIS